MIRCGLGQIGSHADRHDHQLCIQPDCNQKLRPTFRPDQYNDCPGLDNTQEITAVNSQLPVVLSNFGISFGYLHPYHDHMKQSCIELSSVCNLQQLHTQTHTTAVAN